MTHTNGQPRLDFAEVMKRRRAELIRARNASKPEPLMASLNPIDHLKEKDDPRVYVWADFVEHMTPPVALLMSQIAYWFLVDESNPEAETETADGVRWRNPTPAARRRTRPRIQLSEGEATELTKRHPPPPVFGKKTIADLVRETGLTRDQVKGALKTLRRCEMIEPPRKECLWLKPTEKFNKAFQTINRRLGILVHANTVRMCEGSAAAAIVLSQLAYWHGADKQGKCRLQVFRDDHWWAAKTHQELAGETGLRPREVRSGLERLVRQGLIVTARFKFAGKPVSHLRIDPDVFADRWVDCSLDQ